ncbi:DJ-1/PfpI family protein [Colletotrichum falcatum]|nr:DJ-1/PfpI family protein [Colletotrichum falcatum]
MATLGSKKSLRIGVMLEAVQLSDIMGIDLFANLSRAYYDQVKDFDPEFLQWAQHPVDMEFFYISSTLAPAEVTPGLRLKILPNVTYDDCPRDLDLVLVGGNLPSLRHPSSFRFIKEAFPKTRVWLTTCTGSSWLAGADVLTGKKATTNREFLTYARQLHPETEWLDQRWVVDEKEYDGEGNGELWTSGGAGAGLSMVIEYLYKNFDPRFVKRFAIDAISFEELGLNQFYKTSRS